MTSGTDALRTLAFAVAALAACGGSSPSSKVPSVNDYDRRCQAVADCAPVFIGPLGCCATPCPNVAVRASEVMRAVNDVAAAEDCSRPMSCPHAPPCQGGRVLCDHGTCTLEGTPDASSAL